MLAAIVLAILADGEATYKLGGPRRVVAVVAEKDADFEVRIRMAPVGAFDAVTNGRLNRLKAEQFALQALARHLAKGKSAELEVVGGRVGKAGLDGKEYTLTYRVPAKGVRVVDDPKKPAPTGAKRFAFDTPFFTRKRDLIETAKLLGEGLASDLAEAELKAGTSPESKQAFLVRLVDLEERAEACWNKARGQAEADKLLLQIERDEILDEQKKREATWNAALAAAAKRHSSGSKGGGE